jgi:hypothetical protein
MPNLKRLIGEDYFAQKIAPPVPPTQHVLPTDLLKPYENLRQVISPSVKLPPIVPKQQLSMRHQSYEEQYRSELTGFDDANQQLKTVRAIKINPKRTVVASEVARPAIQKQQRLKHKMGEKMY